MLLKNFYSVVNSSEENGKHFTQIEINKDHEIYDGHFPGRPVTPGVILMNLFKEEAERRCGCKLQFKKGNNVKFMAVVDPNTDAVLNLETEITEENQEIKLKGIAKNSAGISLKINSLYKKVES
ncbi:hydroxymyristoyl-ACP dehydratase [Salegentibacter salegens]|uniref:3-hydroxyacyl-[acyl-carrier-protein] dehydratase n=1 Tax=Salegentibacter salegens TaxID=143223 RepID=A0A1M7J2D1_9FLAO|nr:hydroxymyristoyl-ACP dehydratase [Salegentibacter salegens]PRX47388.1 3-hydroxyacyl-[acyl-carrier-protein] dehydratase [Salegentibacter salegens]SHM47108.1 3-hydroxyacyl-[acyl-carrier-protein] dehydratase [Salegentibacter salegens]